MNFSVKKAVLLPALFGFSVLGGCNVEDVSVDSGATASENKVEVGVRPLFLIDKLEDSVLKSELASCANDNFKTTEFSIGHRGAALQFPEHTKESYMAAYQMGAGIIECDVTFTADEELVCRHSQCDLHTTTNILETPLAEKCSVPFTAADGTNPATAQCCTSDITLAEFRTLKGRMDAATNLNATSVAEYLSTPAFRTDLYTSNGGTLMTHKDSIALFKSLGVKMTPELKSPSVAMPFNGDFTQEDYASKMISEYREAGVPASDVFPQSFNYFDIEYWLDNESDFAQQAVYLDGRAYGETAEDQADFPGFDINDSTTWEGNGSEPRGMDDMYNRGVRYVAPPMWVLLTLDANENIVPSEYAKEAKAAGLELITWTLERSGSLTTGGGWYHQSITAAIDNEGDTYETLDVLAQDVGIKGIFSDWPATVTYYANCKGL